MYNLQKINDEDVFTLKSNKEELLYEPPSYCFLDNDLIAFSKAIDLVDTSTYANNELQFMVRDTELYIVSKFNDESYKQYEKFKQSREYCINIKKDKLKKVGMIEKKILQLDYLCTDFKLDMAFVSNKSIKTKDLSYLFKKEIKVEINFVNFADMSKTEYAIYFSIQEPNTWGFVPYEPIGMLYMHQEPHFNNPDYVECESCELEFLNKKLANS